MCRTDDDFDWYVDSEHDETATVDTRCEDCGRLVAAGTPIVRFEVVEAGDEDDRPTVTVVFAGKTSHPGWFYEDIDTALVVVDELGDDAADAFEALGFGVDEAPDPRIARRQPEQHWSCPQCRAANIWLEKVCDQHIVMVTVNDLHEHLHEYNPIQLGPDFITLTTLARQRWTTKLGILIDRTVIDRLARNAVTQFDPTREAA